MLLDVTLWVELSGILVTGKKMLKQSLKFIVFEMTALNKITFLHIHKIPWNVIVCFTK